MKKKKDPAALRTISFLTGKTPLEEAEEALLEEQPIERIGHPLDMVPSAERTAIRWLGLDIFHEGDDVKIAEHPTNGSAVLILVRASVAGTPYSTATIKLSAQQYAKLRQLCVDVPFP